MIAVGNRHYAAHVLAIGAIIFLLGFGVYSLSIDVAHHFLLIDALGKEDPSTLTTIPALQPMALYPPGSHWLAVGLGMLIGSPYAAMWLISLVSVYVGYYALGRLAQLSRGYVALAVFIFFALMLRISGAMTGQEIIGNFFYSQLVATAIFFALIIVAGEISERGDRYVMVLALVSAALLMTVHLLPSLNLLGTIGFAMLIKLVRSFLLKEAFASRVVDLAIYGIAAAVLVLFHPAFAAMRMLSENNGALEFPIDISVLAGAAVIVALISAWSVLWRERNNQGNYDVLIVSAMFASLSLMALQFLALLVSNEGSDYAVKKHLYVVLPLVAVGAARALSSFMPREKTTSQISPYPAIAAAVLATWWVYPNSPVLTMRQVTTPLDFAENAVSYGLPTFQPGNTAIATASVDPISRYMINLSVFRMSFPEALSLLRQENDTSRYALVMYDYNDPIATTCGERKHSSSRYTFVQEKCPSTTKLGVAYPQIAVGSAMQFSGWHPPESTLRWSAGSEASITFSGISPSSEELCVLISGFTLGRQTITTTVDGRAPVEATLEGLGTFTVPLGRVSAPITANLAFSNAHVPDNGDPRTLAFALQSLSVDSCR